MELSALSVFIKLQKRFKRKFNIDIATFSKDKTRKIDFNLFEDKYLTLRQREVLRNIDNNFCSRIIFNGGISSGKTFLASYLLIKFLIQNKKYYYKDTNNFIVGSSIGTLLANTLKQIEKICNLLNVEYYLKDSRTVSCMIAGLTLNVYGGKNSDSFSKIRGSNSAIVYINEATLMHKETLLEIMKRLRQKPAIIIFDTNPDHPAHYFKTDYIDKPDIYRTYNFSIYDNPLNSKDFIETQEMIYRNLPAYKARVLLGEWIASADACFNEVILNEDYTFKSPIMYIDPAFSVGMDNTAICVLERMGDKYYAYVYQDRKPISDESILNAICVLAENFNVNTLYVEDRDNTDGYGFLTKIMVSLRRGMNHYFKISAVKPLSNKFMRICTLIPLFNSRKIEFLKITDNNVINDIYSYSGNFKSRDDCLDALSSCYLLLSLEYKDKFKHFAKSRYI
ncbi:PBSX family phage terminase large subunit (plasmid) [Borrelia anserina]|uniref:Phage terminase-like protein n=2 Tax=Borrelia anserina TaxID=143 RepID=A0ABN4UAI3_BORAN|nr:PBSX family phage terminase large subunit [Borrelia anserina]AHH08960.1 Putative terminase-like family protein [Borrelia anserina BA2]APR65375.1 phage terminase-like protein [Borrelia anserina Es]UPA07338.1 PBSX family phage terminase large subunit [Borrelia anserina]